MYEIESGFYIEHTMRAGWYLFDFGNEGDMIYVIWSTNVEACRYWDKRVDVDKLLNNFDALLSRAHIVDLTKESGYNGYFK